MSEASGISKFQFASALFNGLSKFQPLVGPDGEIVQNCFVNREKGDTLGLCGFTINEDGIQTAQGKPQKGNGSAGQIV